MGIAWEGNWARIDEFFYCSGTRGRSFFDALVGIEVSVNGLHTEFEVFGAGAGGLEAWEPRWGFAGATVGGRFGNWTRVGGGYGDGNGSR